MKIENLKNETYRVRKMYQGHVLTAYFNERPTDSEAALVIADMIRNSDIVEKGSFEDYCNKYIESKSNVLSPSTLGGYKKIVRTLSKELKRKELSKIQQIDIQNEINEYAKDHSPKSVHNLHGFISAVLGVFRPNMRINTSLPQKKKYAHHLPTTDEVQKILKASEGTPYHIPFQLAVLGMRRSEISAAKIEDLHGNYLSINKARIYDENNHIMTRDNTKTEMSTREIYLPDSLVEEIKEAGTIYDLTPPMLVKTLHKYQDALGIERFRLHDFRGFYATYAHSIGIPDEFIKKSGGWASDSIYKTTYRDVLQEKTEEMQKKFTDGLFGGDKSVTKKSR